MRKCRRAGHIILVKDDLKQLFFGDSYSEICHISFGGAETDAELPSDTIKIGVSVKKEDKAKFDILAKIGTSAENNWDMPEYAFDDLATMLSFLDARVKNDILYDMERQIEEPDSAKYKLSVILCTHKISKTLKDCLVSICNQTRDKADYELVFVNNSFRDNEIKELVQSTRAENPDLDISYITAPLKGLSFARNAGLWSAKGEYVLYVDDDAILDQAVVDETIRAFDKDEELGVVGGKVKLTIPEEAKALVTANTIGLWSNLDIEGTHLRYAKDYGEFPYGANFAARRTELRRIGGFRTGYGRVGNNFAGGEETLVCFMMEQIQKKVALNPASIVEHRINEDRFTFEHIEKTTYSGILTQYRLRRDLYAPQDWNDINVKERAIRAEKMAKAEAPQSADFVFYSATAKAFYDVLENRQKDYQRLVKDKI